MNTRIKRFIEILKKKVSKELKFKLEHMANGDFLTIRFRGFVVEPLKIDSYFYRRLELPMAIWYNNVMALRRRLSAIRQPLDWRIRRDIKRIK